ncbi:hypothetical protein GMRT_14560 [Giardia muris]|uniref:Uncharacterized protein n=1 Tax=Giardia muris TaxID=5742 RepID=A0A4Z1SVW4_GIAMU|nr:hypothetical protein GMRT_14560 [Giardia muris]|eukprot:TNJ29045.1 hypothetical protein GMRT_14560 [Giardia muris]
MSMGYVAPPFCKALSDLCMPPRGLPRSSPPKDRADLFTIELQDLQRQLITVTHKTELAIGLVSAQPKRKNLGRLLEDIEAVRFELLLHEDSLSIAGLLRDIRSPEALNRLIRLDEARLVRTRSECMQSAPVDLHRSLLTFFTEVINESLGQTLTGPLRDFYAKRIGTQKDEYVQGLLLLLNESAITACPYCHWESSAFYDALGSSLRTVFEAYGTLLERSFTLLRQAPSDALSTAIGKVLAQFETLLRASFGLSMDFPISSSLTVLCPYEPLTTFLKKREEQEQRQKTLIGRLLKVVRQTNGPSLCPPAPGFVLQDGFYMKNDNVTMINMAAITQYLLDFLVSVISGSTNLLSPPTGSSLVDTILKTLA